MQSEVWKANIWYTENGMIVNPGKHHAMVLGFTDHQFSFTTKDSLDLLGMTIDSQLNFDKQVSLICKKSQQSTECLIRFCKFLNTSTMLKLYNAFVLPHFQDFSVVWHFCSFRNSEKLESFNKRALRVVFNDMESTYSQLLDKAAATQLYNLRVQNMLITIHKCIHINFCPVYRKDVLTLRSTAYSLRGTDILSLCRPASSSYDLHSFKYFACKTWKSLPKNITTGSILAGFKRLIQTISFHST